MDELVKLVKKLTSANASNLLITSDSWFIVSETAFRKVTLSVRKRMTQSPNSEIAVFCYGHKYAYSRRPAAFPSGGFGFGRFGGDAHSKIDQSSASERVLLSLRSRWCVPPGSCRAGNQHQQEPPERCGSSGCGIDFQLSEHHFHRTVGDSALPDAAG